MFSHLHTHSHYSLLDGLPKINDLVEYVKSLGMDSLALTDHGAMYGVIEFYKTCQKEGIKPIVGVEVYIARHGHKQKRAKIDDKPWHLVLLAKDLEGYKNLMKLTSIAYVSGFYYKPRVDKELLKQYNKGLIAMTACLAGEVPRSIMEHNDLNKTAEVVKEYQEIFGKENFYLEIQPHPEIPQQEGVNKGILELGRNLNIPVIATCDSHYLRPDDSEAQDVLVCIQTGKILSDEKRLDMSDIASYLRTPAEMAEFFADTPRVLETTQEIVEKCSLEIPLGKAFFPTYEIPPGKTHDQMLRELAYQGLIKKYNLNPEKEIKEQVDKKVYDRLEYELEVILNKGYAVYFLIVQEFINWMRRRNIPTTTRGSAAGCLVSYLIGINNFNPLIYNLPFERFLNPYRPSLPDIDVDIADSARDRVIEYVKQKYGEDKVAQICTFGTMAARGAVRDVTRVLGLPYTLGDELAKMIPLGKQGFPMFISKALEEVGELKEKYDNDPQVKRILDLAQKIEGSARQISTHAAGVVIAPTDLTDFTPVQKEKNGEKLITQYEMHAVEDVGLVKMDFLGLRNLSTLAEAAKIIKATKDLNIDIENIPLDDAKTYKLLSDGRT
ncbi:MAG: DNA polymerase III subunit alpha, partial [Candidatus Doudnabacteria bacterium]|nr:DNA polymerase III subunit alpha [Candidatus Doudnabacteria bacterium]